MRPGDIAAKQSSLLGVADLGQLHHQPSLQRVELLITARQNVMGDENVTKVPGSAYRTEFGQESCVTGPVVAAS